MYFFRRAVISQLCFLSTAALTTVHLNCGIFCLCIYYCWMLLHKLLRNCYFLRKLLCQSLYFLRTPIFSKQLHISASATFSDVVYWGTASFRMLTSFSQLLFIYHLVINPGVFRFKFPSVHSRVVHHSENHSIKYHEQKCWIKFAFQGSIEQYYIKTCENSVFGMSKSVNSSIFWISVLNQ